jgi:hypothetical protein
MLSPLDDYPVHQVAEVMRHPGTSDRNFYDRYYFNCHPCSDELFLIAGMGQYPNLGVMDAFLVVLHRGQHRVVRASKELGVDRMDTSVGPLHIEVLEGLKRLRVVCEPNEWGLDCDLTFEGGIAAFKEPRHYQRRFERVFFDSMRLAQTGAWTGSINVGGQHFDVTPGQWWGNRDRSWGVRPVGEPEPPGIQAHKAPGGFFWNYAPMQFPDFSILYMVQEDSDGTRVLEEAVRVWPESSGKPPESLGRPTHDIEWSSGTRLAKRATLHLTEPGGRPLDVHVEVMLPLHIGIGTGYGRESDWQHGMYQGPLVVEGRTWDMRDPSTQIPMFSIVENLSRFEVDGHVGYGLFELMCIGPHEQYGFRGWDDMAP